MNPRRGRIFSDIPRVRGSFEGELKSTRVVLTVNSTEPSRKTRKTPKARPATAKGQGGSSKCKRSCYESFGTESESLLAMTSGRYRPEGHGNFTKVALVLSSTGNSKRGENL
jgi:hypothetical protein